MLGARALSRHLASRPWGVRTRQLSAVRQAPPAHVVTTPIFYVNGAPHIGHLYSGLLADALHRWLSLRPEAEDRNAAPGLFSSGTDEHGLKVQQAAAAAGLSPEALCERNSSLFKELFTACGVEPSVFVRTTEPRHATAVHHLWRVLMDRGHIYKGSYEGWYSVADESFVPESQVETLVKDGLETKVSQESGQPVVWMAEDNYMFRLSAFQAPLLDWLESNPGVVYPAERQAQVMTMVSEGLPDLSVSRTRDVLEWGLPVPGDPEHTIYVWLDALTNYYTVGGYPARVPIIDYHILGKDILKFHAIYWPAFLLAAGLELPRQLIVHGHWTAGGKKMSKSIGNVVDPLAIVERYGVEETRFYLLQQSRIGADCDFDEGGLEARLNLLVNSLGNLLSRCTGPKICRAQCVPRLKDIESFISPEATALAEQADTLREHVDAAFLRAEFGLGINHIMDLLHEANAYFFRAEPWHKEDGPEKDAILYTVFEALRIGAIFLQPIIPERAGRILTQLAVPEDRRNLAHASFGRPGGEALGKSAGHLFLKMSRRGES